MTKRLILFLAALTIGACGATKTAPPTKDSAIRDESLKAWHPATDATTRSSTVASPKASTKAATSRSATLDDFGIRDKSLKAWHPATDATVDANSPTPKPDTQKPVHRSFSIASELTVHNSKDTPKP